MVVNLSYPDRSFIIERHHVSILRHAHGKPCRLYWRVHKRCTAVDVNASIIVLSNWRANAKIN